MQVRNVTTFFLHQKVGKDINIRHVQLFDFNFSLYLEGKSVSGNNYLNKFLIFFLLKGSQKMVSILKF